MTKQRRYFAGTEKVAILKRHLLDKVPISDLCDELGLFPNQVYGWLKEFFENGHAAFDNGRKSKAVKAAELQPGPTPHITKKGTGLVQPLEPLEHCHGASPHDNLPATATSPAPFPFC